MKDMERRGGRGRRRGGRERRDMTNMTLLLLLVLDVGWVLRQQLTVVVAMVVPGIGSLGFCCSEVVVVVLSLEGVLILVTVVIISKPGVLCKVLSLSSLGCLEVVCHQVDAAMSVVVAVAVAVLLLMLVPRRQILSNPTSTINTAASSIEKRVVCCVVASTVFVCAIAVVGEEPESWLANRNTTDLGRQACVMPTIMTHVCIIYIPVFIVIAIILVFNVVLDKVDIFAKVGMMKAVTIVARVVVAAVGVSV